MYLFYIIAMCLCFSNFVICSTSTYFILVQCIKYVICIIDCVYIIWVNVNDICSCMQISAMSSLRVDEVMFNVLRCQLTY